MGERSGETTMDMLKQNIAELNATLAELLNMDAQVQRAAGLIAKCLLNGGRLLACGNGGSAADASHLTTEFVCRFNQDRKPYAAISLATHGGDLTAISNDYAFDDLFSRQVEAFGRQGDVLAAFSTSGQSENVRRGLLAAEKFGLKSIAFLGRDGGRCAGLADVELIVQGPKTARIQEAHKLLLHTMCEMVEIELASAK